MKSGTEKRPNPKSVSLTKFMQARSRPISKGYYVLRNGQIIREDTLERRRQEGRVQ